MTAQHQSAHTRGPWHVNAVKNGRIIGDEIADRPDKLLVNAANATIATVYRPRDARLIAAAPDLLQLARAVAEHFADTDAPLGQQARRAIAKATGQN